MNELANRKVRADAIMVQQQMGNKCYAICNEPNMKPLEKQRPGHLQRMLDMKIIAKYNTLDEAAKSVGIDPATLQATVKQMDQAVAQYKDKTEPEWAPTSTTTVSRLNRARGTSVNCSRRFTTAWAVW